MSEGRLDQALQSTLTILTKVRSGDFVAAYEESIRIAVAAFAAEGALTHGWDLARAIGHSTDLNPELAAWLLSQARLVITSDLRGR